MIGDSGGTGATGINVRLACASDAHALARLRYDFRSSAGVVSEGESEFVGRCRRWMGERLSDGGAWRCWVAEREQELVGNLWAQLIEKIPNPTTEPERHAYLTNFYVAEGARGKGVGSTLLSEALRWCEARGVHAAILWPTERSRTLYLRHGFAVREDLLELLVADDR